VLFFAAVGMGFAAFASLRLTPLAIRESTRVINDLAAMQLSAEIQPRVFVEEFPNRILYVGDVRAGTTVVWRPVFLADVSPPEQRTSGMGQDGDGPLITVAQDAIAVSDPKNNRIQLSLHNFATHEMGKDGVAHDISSPLGDQALYAAPPAQKSPPSSAMNTAELIRLLHKGTGSDSVEYELELHRRFALPVACIMLALVGIPLGVSTRKGGKSAGYIIALFLGFFCYHLSSVALVGLAKQKTLPVPVAAWLPNAAFFVAGLIFIARMERPGDRDLLTGLRALFGALGKKVKALVGSKESGAFGGWWLPLLPQIVDTYVLSNFLFYVVLVLASFVSLSEVYFFFELVGDMLRNNISLIDMFAYLFFLTPELIYTLLPISLLAAVLIHFGIMSKNNEVTAFKACGVSLYRLAIPILIGSTLLSGGLFAFDFYYVPGANRKQDALRDKIKGRPKQTYYRPDRKWIMGRGSAIYYYQYFDTTNNIMAGVNVFELDPNTFRLTRQILAERAVWSPVQKTWIFDNGWNSDFPTTNRREFHPFKTATFSELTEEPAYFFTTQLQDKHMNFRELDRYIADLKQRGFETEKLQVQFFRKFSVPLFALIMAMLAIPFGFLVGNRGAMTGIGVSMAIGIAYLGLDPLFQKIGEAGQLAPAVAAWSPDILFSLTGLYFLARMKS
jgi:LPS export ABC transporter permease LptG